MATKPLTLPRPWATNGTYATGPYVGSASKADPGVGVAAEGHRPGAANATAAEHENFQQNQVTAVWVPWVNSGTSLGGAQASIVERDVLGKFVVTGFDVAGVVDVTAATFAGPNIFAPLITATSTAGGVIMQTAQTTSSTSFNAVMGGAATGAAYSAAGTATSSGPCFFGTVPAGSTSIGIDLVHAALGSRALRIVATATAGTQAASIITSGGIALRLTDSSGSGCPLVLTPRSVGPAEPGAVYIDTATKAMRYVDAIGNDRHNWGSFNGLSVASQSHTFTSAAVTGITVATIAQSVNYTFVSGARYWIEMSCQVGKSVAATSTGALFTASVNGNPVAFSPVTVSLFQGAASQLETLFVRRFLFTAASSGLHAVQFLVNRSDASAAINIAQRTINIEGHYD